jgi:hypothetical protein
MFTKDDYMGYFKSIQDKEKEALDKLEKHIGDFQDKDIIEKLTSIKTDEARHCKLALELPKYLDNPEK